jgi:hypothetical protein
MNDQNRPSLIPPSLPTHGPLPPAFPPGTIGPDLMRLDARLTHELRSLPTPPAPGLADRVFEASVGHLPSRRLRLVGAEGRVVVRIATLRRVSWGRVALAASVLLGVGVAWNIMNRSAAPTPGGLARLDVSPVEPPIVIPADPRAAISAGADANALSPEAEGLLLQALAMSDQTDLSYLPLALDLSYYDIAEDLANVFAGLTSEGGL